VIVDNSLEDLAGNRIGRLFDVDTREITRGAAQSAIPKTTTLGFSISARKP
jgi:hypothetical protein